MRSTDTREAGLAPVPRWLDRPRAALLLALVILGIGVGAVTGAPDAVRPAHPRNFSDVRLYQGIVDRMRGGDGYYRAALEELHRHDYPTTPAMAVRLPTVATIWARLGTHGAEMLLVGLFVVATVVMIIRLERAGRGALEWTAAAFLVAVSAVLYSTGAAAWFQETWAMVLILLAIGLHTPRRWWPSVALGLLAVCCRELALPFLVTMAVLAWRRNRREAIAWCASIAVFAVFYALHVHEVAAHQPAHPVPSRSWLTFGGWGFVLSTVRAGSVLIALPVWVAVVAVPLAFLGWLFARGPAPLVLATTVTFACCFLVIGRPNNVYWGLLYGPLLLPGLAFAPRGLVASVRAVVVGSRHG